jgi:fused signal recognition particle receptor
MEQALDFVSSPTGIAAVAGAVVVILVAVVALARGGRGNKWDELTEGAADEARAQAAERQAARDARQQAAADDAQAEQASMFRRLVAGLSRTADRLVAGVDDLFAGRKVIDESLWGDLEKLLVTSDVGIRATTRLLERMRAAAAKEELADPQRLRDLLEAEVRTTLQGCAGSMPEGRVDGDPLVIMVVGVNGAGKTTTIGKLAARYVRNGKKVVIGAGDTFRAAAIEQVVVWGKRAGATVVKQGAGADPAAVAHDAVSAGVAQGADVIICDTAGRLQSKTSLMDELGKVHRVMGKVLPNAPQEVLLVLDSTNGQNAIAQAREFGNAVGVTGIALTKLDGTAKGGVIIGIADELSLPVKLIGIGEAVDDLREFEPEAFVSALFGGTDGALGRGGNSADAAARDQEMGIEVVEEATASEARIQG